MDKRARLSNQTKQRKDKQIDRATKVSEIRVLDNKQTPVLAMLNVLTLHKQATRFYQSNVDITYVRSIYDSHHDNRPHSFP